jgi:hypothetical protein
MLTKKVKRVIITNKEQSLAIAKFHDLFNEASEEEKKMIQVWNSLKNNENKKKFIVKVKPINYIVEKLDNGYELRYFNYTGCCKLYKNTELLYTITNDMVILRQEFGETLPWLSEILLDGNISIFTPNKSDTGYFDAIYTLLKNNKCPPSKRKNIKIIRWKDGEKHARMPKR